MLRCKAKLFVIISDGDSCIVNSDCIETDSTCSNFVCTSSVATQTSSKRNASVQTTQSIDSLSDGPAQLGKSNSFSNRHIRNFIRYSKLESTDAFDDESTQCKPQINFIVRFFFVHFLYHCSWRIL